MAWLCDDFGVQNTVQEKAQRHGLEKLQAEPRHNGMLPSVEHMLQVFGAFLSMHVHAHAAMAGIGLKDKDDSLAKFDGRNKLTPAVGASHVVGACLPISLIIG